MNSEIIYVVITFVAYSFFGISQLLPYCNHHMLIHIVIHAYSKNMYSYLIYYQVIWQAFK